MAHMCPFTSSHLGDTTETPGHATLANALVLEAMKVASNINGACVIHTNIYLGGTTDVPGVLHWL